MREIKGSHNMSNLEADGLQEQKTSLCSIPVSQESEGSGMNLSVCLYVYMSILRYYLGQKSLCAYSKLYSCTLYVLRDLHVIFSVVHPAWCCHMPHFMFSGQGNVLGSVQRAAANVTWPHVYRQSDVFLDFSQYIRLKNKKREVKINILTEPKQTLVGKK